MQELKNKMMHALAGSVKKYRKDKSISQLSNEIGLSKSIWSEMEKGHKDVQLSTFYRIAEALEVKPSELLADIEKSLGQFSFLE